MHALCEWLQELQGTATLKPPGISRDFVYHMKLAIIFVAGLMLGAETAGSGQESIAAFDSFRPDGGYAYDNALQFAGSVGFAFTPTVSGRLNSLAAPLTSPPEFNRVQLGIFLTDARTGFPSTALELFSADGLIPVRGPTAVAPLSFQSSTAPALEAGTKYWLVLSAPQDGEVNWYGDLNDTLTPYYYANDVRGEGFSVARPASAFRITVTAVPEPTTESFVVIALVFLLSANRRRSAQFAMLTKSGPGTAFSFASGAVQFMATRMWER